MEDIKTLLKGYGYTITDEDIPLIQFCKDSVERAILNSCNITAVPDGLLYVVTKRTAGEFLSLKFARDNNITDVNANVSAKSITEGDLRIDFGNGGSIRTSTIDTLKKYGKTEIMSYRKMRW